MDKIKEICLSNFKFFPEFTAPVEISGKHLLLYGENGSGKSSIYWALYTLLECAIKKNPIDIQKYFDKTKDQNLLNVYSLNDPDLHTNSYVKIILNDDTVFDVSYNNTSINSNPDAEASNYASDFINYHSLFRLQSFKNSQKINLFPLFEDFVLPYINFPPINIINNNNGNYTNISETSAKSIYEYIKTGPPKNNINTYGGYRFPYRYEQAFRDFNKAVNKFENELSSFLLLLNEKGNEILKENFGFDIKFGLELFVKKYGWGRRIRYSYYLTGQQYLYPKYIVKLNIKEYFGLSNVVNNPQSFLNEAKLTAIALAIRFAILEQKLSVAKLKILVLDDILISLDMSNRQKVMELIFDRFLDKYQIFILTHDKVLHEFVSQIIRQKSRLEQWQMLEMYMGKDNQSRKEYPIIIESKLCYKEKASKYFEAKEYTACALYIRKQLEKLIIERLPNEYYLTIDGRFKDLSFYWERCIERYNKLGHSIPSNIKESFVQTKLMLLNPQVHHELSHPVYRLEIEKAFKLIEEIEINCPIPKSIILLSKGMQLQFKHPSQNYSFNFELLSDFVVDGLNGNTTTIFPKCKVITWQFNGVDYWDFINSKQIILTRPIEHRLNDIIENHTKNVRVPLGITKDMFISNTQLINGIWSLKEVLNKAGVTI